MNDFSRLSKEDLRRIMDETEGHIREIRAELERRERQAQHEAIDNLELHLQQAKVNWSDVRTFFEQVLSELRIRSK